jgi:hypothetical protein
MLQEFATLIEVVQRTYNRHFASIFVRGLRKIVEQTARR